VAAIALGLLLLVPPGAVKAQADVIDEQTSLYQFIQVVQRPDGRRLLYLNEGVAVHSVWRPHTVLTGGEWDTYLALPPLLGRPLERVAILGNAGGTTARAIGVFYPRAKVDGVELDPAVTGVGRRYFGLDDNPRLTVHTADARPFLRTTPDRYDLIVVDAYHQPYVPFYLATREFFALVRERLAPGGIVALNVAATPHDKSLVHAISGTLATEFPQVLEWPALRFNTIVLGLTRPLSNRELTRRLRSGPARLASLRRLLAREARSVLPSSDPWTDDRAPVEWLTDRMIISFALHGGELEGPPLPDVRRR
jgi:spermidine synthase